MSPALAGGFFTTEPPGQSLYRNFDLLLCFITHKVATVIMLGIVWAYQAEYPKRHLFVILQPPHPLGNSEGPALSAWGAPPAEARSQVPQRPVSMLCWGTCDPVRGGRARRLRPPSRTRGLLRAQSPAAPREAQRRPRTRSSAPSGPARAMRSPSLVLGLRPAAMAPATPERPS